MMHNLAHGPAARPVRRIELGVGQAADEIADRAGQGLEDGDEFLSRPDVERCVIARHGSDGVPQSFEISCGCHLNYSLAECARSPTLSVSPSEQWSLGEKDASERSEASHASGAGRRSGPRESVWGSPRGEAPRSDYDAPPGSLPRSRPSSLTP